MVISPEHLFIAPTVHIPLVLTRHWLMYTTWIVPLLFLHIWISTGSSYARLELFGFPCLQLFLVILLVLFKGFFWWLYFWTSWLNDIQDGIKHPLYIFTDALIEVVIGSVLRNSITNCIILNDRARWDLILKLKLLRIHLLFGNLSGILFDK